MAKLHGTANAGRRHAGLLALLFALFTLFVLVPSAPAVHEEGLFELDENAVAQPAPGDDWDILEAGGGSAAAFTFIEDGIEGVAPPGATYGNEDDVFAQNAKDIQDVGDWAWKDAEPEDKNDIEHAYAAAYRNAGGELILYFGIDRMANNGDAALGMWFLQEELALSGDGEPHDAVDGAHTPGDILVQTDFTTGGSIERIDVYMWDADGFGFTGPKTLVGGDLWRVFEGQDCDADPAGGTDALSCGQVNTGVEDASWIDDGYQYKCVGSNQPPGPPPTGCAGASGVQSLNNFPKATFFEGGVNLTELGLTDVCLATIVAESRSSQSETSTLDDMARGEFNLCGALRIVKNSTKGGLVNTGGATFTVDPDPTDGVGVLTIVDNDANDSDPDTGELCLFPVEPGTYDVTETVAPNGYGLPETASQNDVVVSAGGTCDSGATVLTFVDPPLADIQVRFRDGGSGETVLDQPLDCNNATGTDSFVNPDTNFQNTLTVTGIRVTSPTITVTCTIVIDP